MTSAQSRIDPVTDPDRGDSRAERAHRTAALLQRSVRVSGKERAHLLDTVVELNLVVAEAIASRYRGRGVADDDLVQVAFEGLVKAVRRFTPADGRDLLSFAVPTIRGEIRRHFRDRGWVVRPPRRVQELRQRATGCTEQLQREQGRAPTLGEVADRLGTSEGEYREAMAASGCFRPTSLDRPVGRSPEASTSLGDMFADPAQAHPFDRAEARIMLEPLLARLEGRDRQIVRMRFFEDLTQPEIGRRLGITQAQVSKLLARILSGLRSELESPAEHGRGDTT